ncbi:MAG: urea ABC transporter ATP-binding subunit UrtE [Verrucomicrobiaceae bacterium]
MTSLLQLKGVEAAYDQSVILRGIDLDIPPKSVVSLLGRNGVGKTTTLKTIMGLVSATAGDIQLDGKSLGKMKPENRARFGLGYVPQGRDIFSSMTVWENLKVSISIYGKESADRLDEVYQLFPVLKEMLHRKGGVLSGGQQQQLAIGRALLTRPKVLILDEPTEGIQPSIIDQIEDALLYLKKTHDMSILLVEQYLDFAKAVSDHFYIMDRGTMLTGGPIAQLSDDLITKHLTV